MNEADHSPEAVARDGDGASATYHVLARKYRPQNFQALIGQDAMVRTLTNAIREDRIAHAFILTGVRGVGKTTTARIIARALNCVGADGQGGATAEPCGVCEHCLAIADSRHLDVMEMDAASRTGINDIRELIDGVRYLPVSARSKIYIIDEVHMLSTAAFNGLLKTLEEPPPHVKFIFATTEIRKIPVTVLSRCQRFDLRRVDGDVLIAHLQAIAKKEAAPAEAEALALIARAAEGSVRDGLSLLDQAMVHGNGEVGADAVRQMLGLVDRGGLFDLFEALMSGDVASALGGAREQYDLGADPSAILQDLLELSHWLTRLKVTPDTAGAAAVSDLERARGLALAERLSMPVLARNWQMLLKGLGEARSAPSALAALEMVLIRLCYSAELPPPADVVKNLERRDTPAQGAPLPAPPSSGPAASARVAAAPAAQANAAPAPQQAVQQAISLQTFDELIALAEHQREGMLAYHLVEHVQLIRFEEGRLEIAVTAQAPSDLAQSLSQKLQDWTGRTWMVLINAEAEGATTVAERRRAARAAEFENARAHPLVKAALEAFPDAEITDVRASPTGGEQDEGSSL